MTQYKEFQGKTLDEAIRDACDYYGVPREKLEIDIVSDAKTGIFGLVGVKKAIIRAGRVQIAETVSSILDDGGQDAAPVQEPAAPPRKKPSAKADAAADAAPAPAQEAGGQATPPRHVGAESEEPGDGSGRKRQRGRTAKTGQGRGKDRNSASGQGKAEEAAAGSPRESGFSERAARKDSGKSRRGSGENRRRGETADDADIALLRDDLPDFDLAGCDEEALFAQAREIVQQLINPIVGEVPITLSITSKGLRAHVDCGEAAGLLVGREGQTLSSLQYLAARILSRRMGGAIRVQIDAGDYRERQDGRLRDLALSLAERVRKTGRAFSTRPLTAYQRRIVHLTLEGDDEVQTFSRGEGAQRRVFIQLKGAPPEADADDAAVDSESAPA